MQAGKDGPAGGTRTALPSPACPRGVTLPMSYGGTLDSDIRRTRGQTLVDFVLEDERAHDHNQPRKREEKRGQARVRSIVSPHAWHFPQGQRPPGNTMRRGLSSWIAAHEKAST